MSILKKSLPLSILLMIVFGVLAALYFSGRITIDHEDKNVSITEFSICRTDELNSKLPPENITVPGSSREVYACGFLTTDNPVSLFVYLEQENHKLPVYSIEDNLNKYDEGFFSIKLLLPVNDRKGKYLITIYYFRNELASINFDVADP